MLAGGGRGRVAVLDELLVGGGREGLGKGRARVRARLALLRVLLERVLVLWVLLLVLLLLVLLLLLLLVVLLERGGFLGVSGRRRGIMARRRRRGRRQGTGVA